MSAVSNHVFTCASCGQQYTIHSNEPLDCFFVGLCYRCITSNKLTFDRIQEVLTRLIGNLRLELRVGFTGTELGMNERQKIRFRDFFVELLIHYDVTEFHHGDCIGADAEAHDLVRIMNNSSWIRKVKIVGHPPILDKARAFKQCDVLWEPKEYLERNKDIVKSTHLLIAAPKEDAEIIRSGTWSTVRYAKKLYRNYEVLPRNDIQIHIDQGRRVNGM